MKIVIIGTASPYRGGLATYNERLATELLKEGHDVAMQTFKVQYPNFLFPGKVSLRRLVTIEVDIKSLKN